MSNLTGKTLKNRYEVFEVIGHGGMAIVYKGYDKLLNRSVAIKVLKHEFINDETFIIKFENEAKASGGLNHPNIVNLYDVGEDGDNYFIIMEYIKGKTLKNYVRQLQGFMQEAAIISIGVQVASALCHAHERGIIHRDIKSQNIMIDEDGVVKVTDFGIAKAVSEATTMNTPEVMGSVHYASPEQARGSVVDSRSDLYSTGVLLYELITKETPFNGDTQIQIALKHIKETMPEPNLVNTEISAGLNNIVMKLTQKNPNHRYNNANELRHELSCLKVNENHFVAIENDESSHTKMMDDMSALKQYNVQTDKETNQYPVKKRQESSQQMPRKRKKKQKFNRTSAIIAILLAFVVSGSFFGVLGMYTYNKKTSNKTVIVPEVVNHDVNEAIQLLSDTGLKYDTTEKQFNNDVQKGYIISQSVKAGEELKEGYTVRLIVSNGADLVEVPSVIQKNNREGIVDIENQGLLVGEVIYEYSDLPMNMIISQSIEPGEKVTKDTKVNLTVSQGQKEDTFIVPNLTGKTAEEARKVLSPVGFVLGNIKYDLSDDVQEGEIISHSFKNQLVSTGTRIDVVISNGRITPLPEPEKETTENVDSSNASKKETTVSTPEETTKEEPKMTTKTIKIGANQFWEDHQTIRIELVKDGEVEIVHEKNYDKPADFIKIPISHPAGKYTLKVYFDNNLVNATELVF